MKALIALAVALIACAVYLESWPAVVLVALGLTVFTVLKVLDRVRPEKIPEPTGAELMKAIDEHRAAVKSDLERMESLLKMAQARPRMLRE